MASESTPLLLLLDGILSWNEERLELALGEIRILLKNVGIYHIDLPEYNVSLLDSSSNLLYIIERLVLLYPQFCAIPSRHDGSLPLHFAASLGDPQIAAVILRSVSDFLLLILLVTYSRTIKSSLISWITAVSQCPACAWTPNQKGKTPMHYAAREGKQEIVELFLQVTPYTATIASQKYKLPLHFAAGNGHIEIVKMLLRVYPKGATLPSAKGKLPIHFAARWGNLETCRLLDAVYPEGVRTQDYEGSFPLHDAAREGQLPTARFLLARYKRALVTANIRHEVPLFPAVRSGNVDLVILFLQAWPLGGKYILQDVSSADHMEDWGWDVLELLLRGAVNNFIGCTLIDGKEPPPVRLKEISMIESLPDYSYENKNEKRPQNSSVVSDAQSSPSSSSFDSVELRSKSPVLMNDGNRRVTKSRKRSWGICLDASTFNHDLETCACFHRLKLRAEPRLFSPLHAAFHCEAPIHVIKVVAAKSRDSIKQADDQGRLPLHLAAGRCHDEKEVDFFINDLLAEYPQAAAIRDVHKRMPLHIAIARGADVRAMIALLDTNPSSGVEACNTNDKWRQRRPIHMACELDCDLDVIFTLTRADPSVIQSMV